MPSDLENQSSQRTGQSSQRAGAQPKGSPKSAGVSRSASLGLDAAHAAPATLANPGSRVVRWGLRLGIIVGLAWGIGYLPLQFFGERGLAQYRRLKRERGELQVRNRQLAAQIRQMKLEVERLREDDVFLEKAAREDLGMVRKGELVFVIEEK